MRDFLSDGAIGKGVLLSQQVHFPLYHFWEGARGTYCPQSMNKKTSDTETTKAMLDALRERNPRPEWAFMTDVPNGSEE